MGSLLEVIMDQGDIETFCKRYRITELSFSNYNIDEWTRHGVQRGQSVTLTCNTIDLESIIQLLAIAEEYNHERLAAAELIQRHQELNDAYVKYKFLESLYQESPTRIS